MNKNISIEIREVKKYFSSSQLLALDKVSSTIPQGYITGLVGPDAAGKTTLMRLIAGLLELTAGDILLENKSILSKDPTLFQDVGYMPQRFGLYEDLSVIDNLNLYAALRSVNGEERKKSFENLLKFTDLHRFQKRLAGKLSGGMKQKLGLACALLGKPKILLLDEPGVGVDPQSRRELWQMVKNLAAEGMTILWSTAYMDEAELCDHVIMLDSGILVYEGKPQDFASQVQGKTFFSVQPLERGESPSPLWAKQELEYWTQNLHCVDALIQGSKVRVVLKEEGQSKEYPHLIPINPRLEDAYIVTVGGMKKNVSPFAEIAFTDFSIEPEKVLIEAKNLTKNFGTFAAAKNISFQVKSGQIFGLLGPNGAGKSTTFRMLCGLSKPTSGTCFVNNVSLLDSGSLARSQLGYMAQKFSLYLDVTVKENVRLFGDLYSLPRKEAENRALHIAEALELDKYWNTPCRFLPQGYKQSLALLCATLHQPKVLFLDEPTSGVDPRTRRDFWKHINALTKWGLAVLVTTHFMEEAEYCDDIALIYRGTTIATGTPDALKKQCPDKSIEDPTLEDAFIAFIENYNKEHEI